MPLVHLKTKRLEYKFELTQKYTIIRGDSGVGKTTLFDLVAAYSLDNYSVSCPGYSKLVAAPVNVTPVYLDQFKDCVIFLDENNALLHQSNTASILQNSQNYFVFITRSLKLDYLPIHKDCILEMKSAGKFHTLSQYFTEKYSKPIKPDLMLCEDSNSGYEFMQQVFHNGEFDIVVAGLSSSNKKGGKSKISSEIEAQYALGSRKMCLVYDNAAIGTNYDSILNSVQICKGLEIYAIDWDSFECYVLESPVYNKKVGQPGCIWESRERLATDLLSGVITNYNKTRLSLCLKNDGCSACKQGGCAYRARKFVNLIYWKVKDLYDLFNVSTVGSF